MRDEKAGEPFGKEALFFTKELIMHREVEWDSNYMWPKFKGGGWWWGGGGNSFTQTKPEFNIVLARALCMSFTCCIQVSLQY